VGDPDDERVSERDGSDARLAILDTLCAMSDNTRPGACKVAIQRRVRVLLSLAPWHAFLDLRLSLRLRPRAQRRRRRCLLVPWGRGPLFPRRWRAQPPLALRVALRMPRRQWTRWWGGRRAATAGRRSCWRSLRRTRRRAAPAPV